MGTIILLAHLTDMRITSHFMIRLYWNTEFRFSVELLVEFERRFGRDVAAWIKTIRQQKSIF